LLADAKPSLKFREYFQSHIKNGGLSHEQLYNCDKIGLNFKMLHQELGLLMKSTPGYESNKERVTILACSNTSGNHKLKFAFIGKSIKPRILKNCSFYTGSRETY
jgi:hypothetical protein